MRRYGAACFQSYDDSQANFPSQQVHLMGTDLDASAAGGGAGEE